MSDSIRDNVYTRSQWAEHTQQAREARQVGMGPFAGYYAGDRIVICDKWGSSKATIVGRSNIIHDMIKVEFDVAFYGNRDGLISVSDLHHRSYAEVVLTDDTKES